MATQQPGPVTVNGVCNLCEAICGLRLTVEDGRVVKVAPNPEHPASLGATGVLEQASVLGLYDPDRIPQALARNGDDWDRLSWSEAEDRLTQALRANRGRAVFLTGSTTGTMDRLLDDWCAAAGVERVRFDAFGYEPVRAASRAVYGVDGVPVHAPETVVHLDEPGLYRFMITDNAAGQRRPPSGAWNKK